MENVYTYSVFAGDVVCTAVQDERGGEGLRFIRPGGLDARHAHRVQDILALFVRGFCWGVVAAEVGLDHERAPLSQGREDGGGRRLVGVYGFVRIGELLPQFTFFDGQLELRLGHSSLDMSVSGIFWSREDIGGGVNERDRR
jgi:hypothetical protein